ncbi:MAG TPA: biotin--[acetyl-CoA-carboxylase] ligase [Acidimicrobiales bacterium]
MTSDRATLVAGFRVQWVDETGSTNADLVDAARSGEPAGLVLVADHQTAGRGRLGRRWDAPPGSSLLASVLLAPPEGAPLHGATMAVGLAARAACTRLAGVAPELKWPNDLLHSGRKLAGILAESVLVDGAVRAVVVGMGLNMRRAGGVPAEVAEQMAVLGDLAGHTIECEELLDAWLHELAPRVELWRNDHVGLAREYRASLATLGRDVRVEVPEGSLTGRAVDVTDDGQLVVRTAGGEITVSSGDVIHLRSA